MKSNEYRNIIIAGNAKEKMAGIPSETVHCIVTSPPYYAVRNYRTHLQIWDGDENCNHEFSEEIVRSTRGTVEKRSTLEGGKETQSHQGNHFLMGAFCAKCGAWMGELGLEPTPELYISHLVQIFREVKRILRKDGTCWLNLGDSYWGSGNASGHTEETENFGRKTEDYGATRGLAAGKHITLKPKDLIGIPWRVALALQADGWWLRSDIIWNKRNPMPESVLDRPSKSHEYIFLLTKSQKYYYDAEAIRENVANSTVGRGVVDFGGKKGRENIINTDDPNFRNGAEQWGRTFNYQESCIAGRNKRSIWDITTTPFSEAHFATFPEKLVEPCILAGTSQYGVCAECGKPYERIIERIKLVIDSSDTKIPKDDIENYGSPRARVLRKDKAEEDRQYRRRNKEFQITPPCQPNRGYIDKIPRAESETKYDTKSSTAGRLATLRQGARENGEEFTKKNRTIGWRKTCKCKTNEIKPAIVFDPFFGAGTTGLVALKGGRNFLGIELNDNYIKIAEKRLLPFMNQFEFKC